MRGRIIHRTIGRTSSLHTFVLIVSSTVIIAAVGTAVLGMGRTPDRGHRGGMK